MAAPFLPPRPSTAYAPASSIGVTSAPPTASDRPYRSGVRASVASPAAAITPTARSTPTRDRTTSAGTLRLRASATAAGSGPSNRWS